MELIEYARDGLRIALTRGGGGEGGDRGSELGGAIPRAEQM